MQKPELSHIACVVQGGLISVIIARAHALITYRHISDLPDQKNKGKTVINLINNWAL